MNLGGQDRRAERGFSMAALLVAMTIMAIMMTAALPLWSRQAKREKETELIWRGEQYVHAIGLFQRKFANAFPPTLDVLVEQRFLRRKYKDPMTKDGEFQPVYAAQQQATPGQAGAGSAARPGQMAQPQGAGQGATPGGASQVAAPGSATGQQPGARGGIIGVVSKSTDTSIRIYNGRSKYNEWAFVYSQVTTRAGSGAGGMQGAGRPGPQGQQQPGRPGTGVQGNQGRGQPRPPGQSGEPGRGGRPGMGPPGSFDPPPFGSSPGMPPGARPLRP